MILKCSGKAHPNAGRGAIENCSSTIEVEAITPKSTYLCRSCAQGDSKNGNLRFQNHSFDKELKKKKSRKAE